jgi:Flp pilus assembly protein TadG
MTKAQRGASMVETMLVLMLALLLIFGIMEFGRALFTYHAISNAARLGTRYAIVHGANCIPGGCTATQASVRTYVRDSTPGITKNSMTVTTSWTGTPLDSGQTCGEAANENRGCTVTVTVQYPFRFIVPYFGTGFTFTSSSQMVVSN